MIHWELKHAEILDQRISTQKLCISTQVSSAFFFSFISWFRFHIFDTFRSCSTHTSSIQFLRLLKKENNYWLCYAMKKSVEWGVFGNVCVSSSPRAVRTCWSTESMLFWNAFFLQPVFCYKGSRSSGIRPELRLESLNPDALQSRERAIHLLIWDSKQAFCVERERERKQGGKKCCRVIFRLNVPLHNNLHKQPCVCDKKIGNFQRLCRDWELKAFLHYLPSCSWPPQIPQLLSSVSS